MQDKKELRRQIRGRKKELTSLMRELQSRQVCSSVCSLTKWKEAKVVLLYHALPDEVDTQWLISAAIDDKKTVLLPVVVGDDLELRCYDGQLTEGAFHILEPTSSALIFTDYASIDLAIIPGMAFDAEGHRLGRGKGYYDKLLCQCLSACKIGICFDFQLLPNVPSEAHDVVMDEIVFPLS